MIPKTFKDKEGVEWTVKKVVCESVSWYRDHVTGDMRRRSYPKTFTAEEIAESAERSE